MIAVDQRLENLNFPRFVLTICFIFQPQVVVNGSTKVLSFDDRGAVKNAKYDIVNFVVDDKNGFFNDVSYMVKCVVLELIFVWLISFMSIVNCHHRPHDSLHNKFTNNLV